jgi:hypothetical protein
MTLPAGQARSEKLYTRVKPAAAAAFKKAAQKAGLTPADALREAAELWMRRQPRA